MSLLLRLLPFLAVAQACGTMPAMPVMPLGQPARIQMETNLPFADAATNQIYTDTFKSQLAPAGLQGVEAAQPININGHFGIVFTSTTACTASAGVLQYIVANYDVASATVVCSDGTPYRYVKQ